MKPAEFFYQHAGWSYHPTTETAEQGRRRSAATLATAEVWARDNGIEFEWEDDETINHMREFDCYDVEPQTCETCIARNADGDVVASLGCIDDADTDYRRVVQAELAYEAQLDAAEDYATDIMWPRV
jgi:hypothetical protein